MIRRIFVAIAFVLASSCISAQELSPERFIEQVIGAFNSENLADYQGKFHYPYSRIINGQIEIFDNQNIPAIDFSDLKKTGWVRSRINELQTLAISDQSALVGPHDRAGSLKRNGTW